MKCEDKTQRPDKPVKVWHPYSHIVGDPNNFGKVFYNPEYSPQLVVCLGRELYGILYDYDVKDIQGPLQGDWKKGTYAETSMYVDLVIKGVNNT